MDWYQIKLFVQHSTGWSMDALHVVIGVLLQIGAAWLLRRSVAHPLPLVLVAAATLLNEWNDLNVETWPSRSMQYGESAKDVILTLLLPAVLFLLARRRARVLG